MSHADLIQIYRTQAANGNKLARERLDFMEGRKTKAGEKRKKALKKIRQQKQQHSNIAEQSYPTTLAKTKKALIADFDPDIDDDIPF